MTYGAVGSISKLDPKENRFSRFYRPELDVVRFLAFAFVLLSHYLPNTPGPWAHLVPMQYARICAAAVAGCEGLSLFFALSAYLIVEILLRERETTGTVRVKQFYFRRILRIWPLYFAGLAIALAVALHNREKDTVIWVGLSFVMLGNWFLLFHSVWTSPMSQLWSISIEEQFYLFAPWLVKRLTQFWLVNFAVALALTANLCIFVVDMYGGGKFDTWPISFIEFEFFAAGILLCIFVRRNPIRLSLWHRLLLFSGAVLFWVIAVFSSHVVSQSELVSAGLDMGHYALISMACCLLLLAFHQIERNLLPQFLIYLGRISYGLYVFHMLSLQIAFHLDGNNGLKDFALRKISAVLITIVLAALSYRYFETPFLRLKKRHEIIESRPI